MHARRRQPAAAIQQYAGSLSSWFSLFVFVLIRILLRVCVFCFVSLLTFTVLASSKAEVPQ
jgi:hypothetical protein